MRAVAALATLALAAADHQLQPPRPALARARLAPTSQQATKSCQSRLRLGRRENSSRARAVSSASRSAAGLSARGGATRVVAEPAFRGLRRDLRTFASTYGSHLRDGCSVKVLSAVCFLVFGCLAPAVGFGSLCGSVTEGAMGTMEMVLGTSVTGMAYALLAGQPLTIVGSTGPVLAFISALYRMAKAAEVPFLPLYAWTGLWASAILAVCAVFSLSNAVEFLSRFTDDIFANLISFIFIYEACRGLAGLVRSPQVPAEQALLGILLALMTVSVARTLQGLRSVNHVKALHEYERAHPGLLTSSKLEVCGTRENRLSGFLIHALIGATVVWFRPLLRSVPNAALSGLFLYLGLSALKGNQMWERAVSLVSDPALDDPNTPWAPKQGVPRTTTLAFTAVQFLCLALLVGIKDTELGVLFPVVVAGLAPVRLALPALGRRLGLGSLFDESFLATLDADEF